MNEVPTELFPAPVGPITLTVIHSITAVLRKPRIYSRDDNILFWKIFCLCWTGACLAFVERRDLPELIGTSSQHNPSNWSVCKWWHAVVKIRLTHRLLIDQIHLDCPKSVNLRDAHVLLFSDSGLNNNLWIQQPTMLINDNAQRFDHSLNHRVTIRDLAIGLHNAVSRYRT